jgi:hypothetical protein
MYVFLTAAHCVTMKGELLRAEDFIIYLGRYNLRNMNEHGLQYKDVSTFYIIYYRFLAKDFQKFMHFFPRYFYSFWTLLTFFSQHSLPASQYALHISLHAF